MKNAAARLIVSIFQKQIEIVRHQRMFPSSVMSPWDLATVLRMHRQKQLTDEELLKILEYWDSKL